MRQRITAPRRGTHALDAGKIKNDVLRRNTARCHTQRHVTRGYHFDEMKYFLNHRIVTASSKQMDVGG